VKQRTGGQILADQLVIHGVRHAFCVPGESYLALLDALYDVRDRIELVSARQDGGAGYMAGAYGKLTGEPGICFVTRGPGATNASIAVHTAFQDSDPMILFVGQVASDQVEREAFQEIDYRRMFGPMAKWVAQVDRADRIPEYVSRAFHTAVSGRPGPVVLALPEDMLSSSAEVIDAMPYRRVQAAPAPADMESLAALVASSERPIVILGGAPWSEQGVENLRSFIEAFDLPVGCAYRMQDMFDNAHLNFIADFGIGTNPAIVRRVAEADLVLAIGARLGEITTGGYKLLKPPVPVQKLVHVHPDPSELGRVYQGNLLINSGMDNFARAARELRGVRSEARTQWRLALHADYVNWRTSAYSAMAGDVELRDVVAELGRMVPADAIIANGAGNYSGWLHRFHQYRRFRTQLGPTAGSMGFGVPAAIAAKIRHPDRVVISVNGDGDYLMNGQELATAVHHRLAIVFIVVNNGMYGTIRMHQERHYPGRVHGTDLTNPDFVALARAYGAHGELVTRTAEFGPALARSLEERRPALIEIRIDPTALSPQFRLKP
jgi:acetolactate synthase-1/2/3 large subunit